MRLTDIKFAMIVAIMALLLTACVSVPMGSVPTAVPETPATEIAPTTPAEEPAALADTQWTLVLFGTPDSETPVVEGSIITIEFSADGTMGGSSGCNSYGGSYQVADGMIVFGEIVSTLMACADESVMVQEQEFLIALNTASAFTITEDTLTVEYESGVLTFSRGVNA